MILFMYKGRILQMTAFDTRHSEAAPEVTEDWAFAEPIFIRFGRVPCTGKSINNLTNKEEAGVSVWRGWRLSNRVIVDMPNLKPRTKSDLVSCYIDELSQATACYIMEGKVIRKKGSIGEPLMVGAAEVEKVRYSQSL